MHLLFSDLLCRSASPSTPSDGCRVPTFPAGDTAEHRVQEHSNGLLDVDEGRPGEAIALAEMRVHAGEEAIEDEHLPKATELFEEGNRDGTITASSRMKETISQKFVAVGLV